MGDRLSNPLSPTSTSLKNPHVTSVGPPLFPEWISSSVRLSLLPIALPPHPSSNSSQHRLPVPYVDLVQGTKTEPITPLIHYLPLFTLNIISYCSTQNCRTQTLRMSRRLTRSGPSSTYISLRLDFYYENISNKRLLSTSVTHV